MADSHRFERVGLVALGVPVVVRCGGSRAADLAAAVRTAWQDCLDLPALDDGEPLRFDVVVDDDVERAEAAALEGAVAGTGTAVVLDGLSPRVTLAAIERNAGRLLMLHACGLAGPDGGTVALVAPSGTGKTTLARTLGDRLGYVTDETVGVLADGTVVPYPKPLSLLDPEVHPLKRQAAPGELGLRAATGDLRLAGVAVLQRDPAGPELEAEPVGTVPALALLGPETSYLRRLPTPLHRLAAAVESTGGLRRLHYREAAALGELLGAWTAQPAGARHG